MTVEDYESNKPLTRDQILNTEKSQKVFQLPSGITVKVAFLSWGMVEEIDKNISAAVSEGKERIFTEKVISWILRGNDQKDLRAFSEIDQNRLIEIAVEEWGCEEEYEQFTEIENPEVRFYQAVNQQERDLAKYLSESVRVITTNLASTMAPLKNVQMELASSMKGMLEQFGDGTKLGDVLNNLNARAIEQMGDIFRLQSPILEIAAEIATIPRSLVLPSQSILLESLGDTITSYQNLMENVLPVKRFSILPDSVRYYPTIETHNISIVTGRLLNSEILRQDPFVVIMPEETKLLGWLTTLDPWLPKMLQGAKHVIYDQNPDRCRHFASSYRELCTHILHLLAPDGCIKNWTQDPIRFDDKGRPTRKARLLYIARNYNNKHLVNFLIKDFENQMDWLNDVEHRLYADYSDSELLLLHDRFLSLLGFIMQIYYDTGLGFSNGITC